MSYLATGRGKAIATPSSALEKQSGIALEMRGMWTLPIASGYWVAARPASMMAMVTCTLSRSRVGCNAIQKFVALLSFSHQGQRVLLIEPCRSAPPLDLEAIKKSLEWASLGSVRVCAKLPVDRRHNGKIVYSELLKLLRN
jgi:hypothetical protein